MKNFLIILVLVCLVAKVYSISCGLEVPNMGSSFDLAPMTLGSYYNVEDIFDDKFRNYTYAFNFCKAFKPPSQCNKNSVANVSAIQIAADGSSSCYVLGLVSQTSFSLLDAADPSFGVQLKYSGGENTACPSERAITIQLQCADTDDSIPADAVVAEYNKCEYTLRFKSIYGCPLECGVSQRRLCSGNGVCRYSQDSKSSKCYCDEGLYGTSCEFKVDPTAAVESVSSCGSLCVVFSVVLVIMFILIAGAIAILYHVHRIENSKNRFDNLKSQFSIEDGEAERNETP